MPHSHVCHESEECECRYCDMPILAGDWIWTPGGYCSKLCYLNDKRERLQQTPSPELWGNP